MDYLKIKNIQTETDEISIAAGFIDNIAIKAKTYFSQSILMLYKSHIFDSCMPRPNSLCLDICCGAGSNSIIVGSKHNCKIIAFDISLMALRRGQKMKNNFGLDNVEFLNADIFHLPFRDAIFDYEIATQSLSYYKLEEQKKAIENIYASLKVGAFLILSDANVGSTRYNLWGLRTYNELLKELGFRIIKEVEWGHEIYQLLNKIRSKFVNTLQKK